jgi:hypothetical protein
MLARAEQKTVKEIARSVPKSAALSRAERKKIELRGKRDEINGDLKKLIGNNNRNNYAVAINKAAADERAIDEELLAVRSELAPLRADHAGAIAKVLAPMRRAAAEQVLESLTELRPALATLAECVVEIERAGGQTMRIPPLRNVLADLESRALRLVGNKA